MVFCNISTPLCGKMTPKSSMLEVYILGEIYRLHLEKEQEPTVIFEATAYRRLHISVDAELDVPALKFTVSAAVLAAFFQL